MNKHIFKIYTIIFLVSFGGYKVAFSQNNTNSPYSMYGIGELRPQSNIVNSAMGNAGIAVRTNTYINMLNPAGYHGVDSLGIIFDTGVDGKLSTFKQNKNSEQLLSANFSYFALACRISPSFAFGLGINPYSSSGYEINSSSEIEGTNISYPTTVKGSGDISRAYFALSYSPFKNLSLGIKSSFLFGKLEQTQYSDLSTLGSYSVYNTTKDFFYNFFFEFGAQYLFDVKNYTIGLGAIVTPAQSLLTNREITAYSSSTIFNESIGGSKDYPMPLEIGFGLYVNDNEHLIYTLDIGIQQWENYAYSIQGVRLKNNPYIRGGVEYTPSNNFLASFFQRVNYRLGARFNQDYIYIRGQQLKETAITCGLGLPIKKGKSRIDISLEGGTYGTTKSSLIKENYLRLRLGFSMHDIWFQTRKFN